MAKDKCGRPIIIGDTLIRSTFSGFESLFTVEEIREDDEWVWGSELPKPYTSGGDKNWHNPIYLEKHFKNGDTHRGNIIKFNFK